MTPPEYTMRAPGGWARTLKLAIGAAGGLAMAGAIVIFGTSNGGQAEHYCEGPLVTSAAAGGVAKSCRNPFKSETGVLLASTEQGLFLGTNPYPLTAAASLDGGVAANSTASGNNLFDNVKLFGAKRFLSTAATGSTVRTSGFIAVGSGQYLNLKWGVSTSGATVSGLNPGFVRLKWFNCSQISSLVDC